MFFVQDLVDWARRRSEKHDPTQTEYGRGFADGYERARARNARALDLEKAWWLGFRAGQNKRE